MAASVTFRALATAPPGVIQEVPCAVCGADDVDLRHTKASPEGEIFPIVRCRRCGLVYVSPRRRPDTLVVLYRRSAYFRTKQQVVSGYSDYIADGELHRTFFRHQLHQIERYVKSGRLLDVGCAMGFLLDEARRRGWQTQGVDLSEFASNYARAELGLPVFTGLLRDARYPDGHFDAVVMDDVIEHVGDPEAELAEVRRILRPGGVVLLHTPNADSFSYRVSGRHWVHLKPGEHLVYFSPRTLTALLEKLGFQTKESHASGKPTNLRYIALRVPRYGKTIGLIAQAIVRWIPFSRAAFPFRTGEMELLAVRR